MWEMSEVSLKLDYLTPSVFIGFWVLLIGLIFTGIMFYFVFFRLSENDESYKDRERKKLKKIKQQQEIARLYPKNN